MFRSFTIGALGYAASAAIFLIFSIFFVHAWGADTYGTFSLLLNTVSALTMFGNYHGALVAFAPAVERLAFRAMLRKVLVYAAGASIFAAIALSAIGNFGPSLYLPVAAAFLFIIVSGLPTSVVLASAANWMVNVARAVYQSLLILAFWALFSFGMKTGTAFALALLTSAAAYLAILASRVRFLDQENCASADPAPRGILLLSMFWNVAHMAVMLTDKFAIRYLDVGVDATDVGVFLLYFDIGGRFSAIYVVGLAPLTYELLRRLRAGESISRPAAIALAVCLLVGAAVTLAGYYVLPAVYGTNLAGKQWLPAIIGVYLVLLGFGSVFLAYCNSTGRVYLLLWHYLGVFVTGGSVLYVLYAFGDMHLSVNELAAALAAGQCFIFVSVGLLAACDSGRRRKAGLREIVSPTVAAHANRVD